MGRAARANKEAPRTVCEGCDREARLSDAEPYIMHADKSAGYACKKCMQEWRSMGIMR